MQSQKKPSLSDSPSDSGETSSRNIITPLQLPSRRCFSMRIQPSYRKLAGDTVATVVCSSNPSGDFEQSIREMIKKNETTDVGFLRELFCCYLTMNSPEYHRVIAMAFGVVLTELGLELVGPANPLKKRCWFWCST